ncbi:B12-binding domain-containing radical SAM protein [Ruminiclostridium cellobioparum]|uniref:Fe-S oxidoreductase n=1 Tax=Ruminiclostridium cellobioparum subsp. termitidis CT1112 TaxID=1195236 RepID=S0FGK3_RUMCE|nr:radical SAM protein [Ruminiclostridium cellobioparum]EMS70217.1 Fe-S oxidoreductase [Ruminiclostridium cellobioparum subsp. termitidis CT1112]
MKILAAFYIDDMEDMKDNVGFNYVIAALRQAGHEVEAVHDRFENFDMQKIIQLRPQVAMFSLYDWYLAKTLKLIRKIKEQLTETTIIVGGPSVHFSAEKLLEDCWYIDYAVYGEGEETVVELLEKGGGSEDIPNLVYRENGRIVKTDKKFIENLDTLPIPLSSIPQQYSNYLYVGGDRGCTGNCSFCTTRAMWDKWRPKSNESIAADLEFKVNRYNKRNVFFTINSLDNPNLKIDKLKDLCRLIIERKIDVSFLVPLRAEAYKNIDDNDIELLKRAGLYGLFIGVEAGNAFDLKLYNKSCKLIDCYNAVEFYKRNNLYIEVGYIAANPYSTLDRLRENAKWLYQNKLSYYQKWLYSYYMPFRGCALFDKIRQDDLLVDRGFEFELECKYKNIEIERFVTFTNAFIKSNEASNFRKTNIFMEIDKLFSKLANIEFKDERYSPLSRAILEMKPDIDEALDDMSRYNYRVYLELLQCIGDRSSDRQIFTIMDGSYNNSDFEKKLQNAGMLSRKLMLKALSFDYRLLSFIR